MVEHGTENAGVDSSSLSLGTSFCLRRWTGFGRITFRAVFCRFFWGEWPVLFWRCPFLRTEFQLILTCPQILTSCRKKRLNVGSRGGPHLAKHRLDAKLRTAIRVLLDWVREIVEQTLTHGPDHQFLLSLHAQLVLNRVNGISDGERAIAHGLRYFRI